MTRVLVIGRSGQIASALYEHEKAEKAEVTFLGRSDLDLTNAHGLRERIAALQPDVVVNVAAFTAVDRAESEPELAHAVNAVAPGILAAGAADAGAALIHLSTDYVFNGEKASPYTESDQPDPRNVYGRSKLAGELAIADANPRHVILRTAWVYAPFGTNFVRTMLRVSEKADTVSVVDDQIGNPTYAPHLAAAILRIASRVHARPDDSSLSGVFNLAGQGDTTWAGMAEAIFAGAAARGAPLCQVRPISTRDYPTAARRPANSRLQCDKILAIYGIATSPWRGALDLCLDRLMPGQASPVRPD